MEDNTIPVYEKTEVSAITAFPMLGIYYTGPYRYAKATASQTAATALVLKADDTDGATTTALTVVASTSTTYGDVVDAINAISTTGWHAKLIGARRSDLVYNGSSQVTWAALSATSVKKTVAYLYQDATRKSVDVDSTERYILPIGITNWYIGSDDVGRKIAIDRFSFKVTYTAANNKIQIWECDDKLEALGTDVKIYETTAGATGVAVEQDQSDFEDQPIVGAGGKRVIVRIINDNAMTVPLCKVYSDGITQGAISHIGQYVSRV